MVTAGVVATAGVENSKEGEGECEGVHVGQRGRDYIGSIVNRHIS